MELEQLHRQRLLEHFVELLEQQGRGGRRGLAVLVAARRIAHCRRRIAVGNRISWPDHQFDVGIDADPMKCTCEMLLEDWRGRGSPTHWPRTHSNSLGGGRSSTP